MKDFYVRVKGKYIRNPSHLSGTLVDWKRARAGRGKATTLKTPRLEIAVAQSLERAFNFLKSNASIKTTHRRRRRCERTRAALIFVEGL